MFSLSMHGSPIGSIEYKIIEPSERIGQLGRILVKPDAFSQILHEKIIDNPDRIRVRGGYAPGDLSKYPEGIASLLESLKRSIQGFDYQMSEELRTPETFNNQVF